jgi:hypothetical protein
MRMTKCYTLITDIIYLAIAASMVVAAGTIVFWAGWNAVRDFSMNEEWIVDALTSLGALVVALAVVDVANYMFEEEVFRSAELRTPAESRATLTKISVIIIIALNLEALVYVFKAGNEDISLLIYPTGLVVATGVVMVFLGIYQRLSATVEQTVGQANSLVKLVQEKAEEA